MSQMPIFRGPPVRSNPGLCRCLSTAFVVLACLGLWPASLRADSLDWRTNRNLVTADIKSADLLPVLDEVARATGWQIFVEPGVRQSVSAKFKDLAPGEAMGRLVGNLNFALVPSSNAPAKLFVFRTKQQNATQLVNPSGPSAQSAKARPIPNELIVRLKPGANITEIAKALGAKVVGKIDNLNAYRLQFDDEQETGEARTALASNSDVESVQENFEIDRPEGPRQVLSTSAVPPQLQLKPATGSSRVIVGLVDTAVQQLGNNLDVFLLKPLSVAGDATLDPSQPSHGTAMAETILRSLQAATQGSTSVQILPVDVYGARGTTTTFDVAAGMVAAVNGGATVLNLSLGSDADTAFLRDLVKELASRNIAIFAAKGNAPVTTAVYPAAYPEVTAVTATERGQVVPWANKADIPAVGAPSGSVIYYQDRPWYSVGTSVSTAIVSGLAAGFMDTRNANTTTAIDYIRTSLTTSPGSTSGATSTGP